MKEKGEGTDVCWWLREEAGMYLERELGSSRPISVVGLLRATVWGAEMRRRGSGASMVCRAGVGSIVRTTGEVDVDGK